jgi:hypothetical protein
MAGPYFVEQVKLNKYIPFLLELIPQLVTDEFLPFECLDLPF